MHTTPNPVADAGGNSEAHASKPEPLSSVAHGVRTETNQGHSYFARAANVPSLEVRVAFFNRGDGAAVYTHAEVALMAILGTNEAVLSFARYLIALQEGV